MSKIHNNSSKLSKLYIDLINTLSLIERLNPIFNDRNCSIYGENGLVFAKPPNSIGIDGDGVISYVWYVLENIVFRYEKVVGTWGYNPYPSPLRIFLNQNEVPYYINLFTRIIYKHYKGCLIIFDDYLPDLFGFDIIPNYKSKLDKSKLINKIGEELRIDRNDIHKVLNKNIDFKKSLSEVLRLSSIDLETFGSYCLNCGCTIPINKIFCNATNYGYANPDNCRNKLRTKLQRRKIKNPNKYKNKMYKELRKLIQINPIGAFEDFQLKHKYIYQGKSKVR